MADAEQEQQPPQPKEKEKKKRKSSSVKSNKSASEEAPQLNGEAAPDVAVTTSEAPQEPQEEPATVGEEKIAAPPEKPAEPTSGEEIAPQENGVAQDGEADVAVQEEAESAAAVAERKKSLKKKEKSAAKQKAEEEAALAQENKMREFAEGFFLLDWNKDGQIDKTDLQMTFASLGFPNVSDEEIQGMLSEASSPLDIDSFIELMGKKVETMDAEELLVKALSCWDEDSSGFISEERIRHDLMKWGDTFTEQEVNYALEDAPLYEEPEGLMINYIEFCKILCGSAAKN
ncbi:myosin regulatory light polypeptide 9-like [Cloeon dipterum]|uniref:myosin regulatory light polypeptide 9-like n=1 Tax=Cloeon dipterum TaxID=197152 RepID=UPI003220257A